MNKIILIFSLILSGFSYSQDCNLVKFRSNSTIGEALIDIDFLPLMKEICDIADSTGVKLMIISSHKTTPRGKAAEYTPEVSDKNIHFAGHSIDVFIKFSGGVVKRQYINELDKEWDPEIKGFIEAIRNHPLLRTGEHSNQPDYIHIEDALSQRDPEMYNSRIVATQASKDAECAQLIEYISEK